MTDPPLRRTHEAAARIAALAALCGLADCFAPPTLAGPPAPDARALTDPLTAVSPANPAARPIAVEDFFHTRSAQGASWSPDGRQVAFTTDITGRHNLWLVSATGGRPVQLVRSEDRQFGAAWSPDKKWIAFQQDVGGNELWDVFVVTPGGGQAINLTQSPASSETSPLWSPDGTRIAVEVQRRGSPVIDLGAIDFATRKMRYLTHERSSDHSWSLVAWSPDGRTLYATRYAIGLEEADAFAVDVASGRQTNLTPHAGHALNKAASLSPDGRTLLMTSTTDGGHHNVALLDIRSGERTWVTHTRWDASAGYFAPDGSTLTYTLSVDGVTDAYLVDTATRHATRIPLPAGVSGFDAVPSPYSPSGTHLLLTHESSVQPSDLWLYDIKTGTLTQLTHSAVASLDAASLPRPQTVHYRSFDGTVISALLWVPPNLKRDGSNAAVVEVHGGPADQAQDYWNPWIAVLVARGFICIAPNVRGSSGYGSAFQKANYQDLGGADLQDEVYAARFLQQTGYVDRRRIGIMGGSYGGFMTLMAIGRTPDVWAAAVDYNGIINWLTMLEHADPHLQRYIRSLLGDPVRDRRAYVAASPLTYLHNATAPLLVLQGDNDPRVPREEADQVVTLLTRQGKTIEARYYAGEGHGFVKREDRIDTARRTVAWFERYLRGAH